MYNVGMPVRRIQRKFEAWREEPEHVRFRIASLLTAGSGVVLTLLWLVVLLPLQLRLSSPNEPDEVTQAIGDVARGRDDATPPSEGAVSGAQDQAIFEPTPNPADATLYHGTRPTRRRTDIFMLASPSPAVLPTTTLSPAPSTSATPVPTESVAPSAPVEITE